MATTNYSPIFDVMPFNECPDPADDDRVIIKAALTSSDAIDGAFLKELGSPAASLDYNSNGVKTNYEDATNVHWLEWSVARGQYTAPQGTAYGANCHVHFEVESSYFTDTAVSGGADTLLTLGHSGVNVTVSTGGSMTIETDAVGQLINTRQDQDNLESSHVTIDIIQNGGDKDIYQDGRILYRLDRNVRSDGTWFDLLGRQNETAFWSRPSRIRNLYVVAGPAGFSHDRVISNTLQFGDSLFEQGNFLTGYEDLDPLGSAGDFVEGFSSHLQGILQRKNVRAILKNQAVSGDKVADTQAVIDTFASLAGWTPILNVGINDINAVAGFPDTDYLALVDDIVSLSPTHTFINTMTPAGPDSAIDATEQVALLVANDYIRGVAADNSANVTCIDLHAGWPSTFDPTLHKTSDQLHWSAKGGRLAARITAAALLAKRGAL